MAAKDAIIENLTRELDSLRAKLAEAERKYHHLNTTTAAELVSLSPLGCGGVWPYDL